jgi:hypothetical protein
VVGRENNGLKHRKRRESEGGKNRDKKIVMVKLAIQKKKSGRNNKKFSLFGKSSGLTPQVSNPHISVQVGALIWSHPVTGL